MGGGTDVENSITTMASLNLLLPSNIAVKRSAGDRSPDPDDQQNTASLNNANSIKEILPNSNWSRYIVIESTEPDKPISSLSPFVIEKAVQGIAGAVQGVRKLRSGALLIETLREAQANNLLKLDSFASLGVKVSPH